MERPLQDLLKNVIKNFSGDEGEKRLKVASLWEDVSKHISKKTQIFKIENGIVFIKVSDPIIAQEMKLKVQRNFIKRYKETFGEDLKNVRFLIGK